MKKYQSTSKNTKSFTVQNLESFYNYRSVGKEFKLFSSVLSLSEHLIEMKIRKKKTIKNPTYEVIDEIKLSKIPQSLMNLHIKKHRITSAFSQIKEPMNLNSTANNNLDTGSIDDRLVNVFSMNNNSDNDNDDEDIQKTMPGSCRPLPGSLKKPACYNCRESCSFSMENTLHPTKSLTQNDILDELEIHRHPKSRIIKIGSVSRQRVTFEAARELADHYIYAHKKKEPRFL